MSQFEQVPSRVSLERSTLRPIGVYLLSGLATVAQRLLAVDAVRGYLVEISPGTDNTTILNPHCVADWTGAVGLAIWQERLWFAKDQTVYISDFETFVPAVFAQLPYDVNGVAIWEDKLYVTCQKSGYIHVFDRERAVVVEKFPQPGVGAENITATADSLWLCDRTEQTVYQLDRTSGELLLSALTPFPSPTGITFYQPANDSSTESADTAESGTETEPAQKADPLCYVSYAYEEPYIRDDPNADSPHQLTFRDRTFIHPLHIHQSATQPYTLSNGYLVEISYVEELLPLDPVPLSNVEWRIALPADTLRQKVRHVEPIGHPFTLEEQNGQKVAVFRFDALSPNQGGLIGWKATVEMYSLKYFLTPADVEDAPPLSEALQQQYLVDDDDLAMDSAFIQQAAQAAAGTETNVLRKMLKIRNYVYDHMSYGIQPKIDTPDVALARGVGSCGEYVGILLALARLNGIACRTIGRYKCPATPALKNLPLEPDFNHVWIEFYVPGVGWLPMESNVDDVVDRGPYPTRFFMGLSWYHTELGKGIPFGKMNADNKPEELSIGDLAINHIRFTILEELVP